MLGNAHARKEKYDMSLKNRHFLKLLDFTPEEITAYLDLAAELKAAKKSRKRGATDEGKKTLP